jgi:hypothetical protein
VSAQPPQWQPSPHQQRPQPGQQPQGRQPSPQQGPPRSGGPPGSRRANGGSERPPASRRTAGGGRVAVAAALSFVLLIAMFSAITWAAIAAARERERIAAQPSPTPYSVPKSADPTPPGRAKVLAKLPDLCPKLATALPADLRPGSPEHSKVNDSERQNCLWVFNNKRKVTWVSIEVVLYPDLDPDTAIATAGQELAEEKENSADTKSNGGFHKNVQDVTGVGDEAFSDAMSNIVIWTEDGPDGKEVKLNYHVAGANLGVRSGNATIEVAYLSATYPESQNLRDLHGTNITYDEALPKTKQIVETIIGQLK